MGNPNKITFSGQVPPEGLNGLAPLHDELLDDPHRMRLVIGLVDVAGHGGSFDRDETWPICRYRQVEVVLDEDDFKAAAEIMARAMAERTGGAQLPFPPGEVAGPPVKERKGGAERDPFPEEGDS